MNRPDRSILNLLLIGTFYIAAMVHAWADEAKPVCSVPTARLSRPPTHRYSFDGTTTDFEDIVRAVAPSEAGLLTIMHTPVPDIPAALEVARRHWTGPLGVYPESGYFEMPNWQFVDVISPGRLVDAARGWLEGGQAGRAAVFQALGEFGRYERAFQEAVELWEGAGASE